MAGAEPSFASLTLGPGLEALRRGIVRSILTDAHFGPNERAAISVGFGLDGPARDDTTAARASGLPAPTLAGIYASAESALTASPLGRSFLAALAGRGCLVGVRAGVADLAGLATVQGRLDQRIMDDEISRRARAVDKRRSVARFGAGLIGALVGQLSLILAVAGPDPRWLAGVPLALLLVIGAVFWSTPDPASAMAGPDLDQAPAARDLAVSLAAGDLASMPASPASRDIWLSGAIRSLLPAAYEGAALVDAHQALADLGDCFERAQRGLGVISLPHAFLVALTVDTCPAAPALANLPRAGQQGPVGGAFGLSLVQGEHDDEAIAHWTPPAEDDPYIIRVRLPSLAPAA